MALYQTKNREAELPSHQLSQEPQAPGWAITELPKGAITHITEQRETRQWAPGPIMATLQEFWPEPGEHTVFIGPVQSKGHEGGVRGEQAKGQKVVDLFQRMEHAPATVAMTNELLSPSALSTRWGETDWRGSEVAFVQVYAGHTPNQDRLVIGTMDPSTGQRTEFDYAFYGHYKPADDPTLVLSANINRTQRLN